MCNVEGVSIVQEKLLRLIISRSLSNTNFFETPSIVNQFFIVVCTGVDVLKM